MGVSLCRSMPPVSISSSIIKVVTPLRLSPLMIAQFIGAAPLYCGSKEPCRLNVPRRGIDQTTLGSIRNATTMKRSAFRASREARKSGSRSNGGCSRLSPLSLAKSFTALSPSLCPRPAGLSGTVTTPTTLYPLSSRLSRGATANSGVPI